MLQAERRDGGQGISCCLERLWRVSRQGFYCQADRAAITHHQVLSRALRGVARSGHLNARRYRYHIQIFPYSHLCPRGPALNHLPSRNSQQWQFWNACLRRRMSTASASSDNVQQRGCTAYGNVPLQQLSFQKMVARCSAMLYLTLRLRKASNSPDFPCRREDHPIVYRADLAYFMIRWRYGRDRIDQRGANPTRADEGCRADLVSEQHSAQQRTSRHPYRCLPEHHSV
jgi:hypothetical protein